ncbi:MAG TPA: hypothetical protein VFV87_07085 [Pirellulaceae bacterium]|nr:hypothetical protein [Pirellulaceae bacterium]
MHFHLRLRRPAAAAVLHLALGLVVGCGGSGPAKAPVKGKVLAGGQPVTAGRLTFAPADGIDGAVPIVGQIQTDGTFVMSTDRPGDGIAIGKHLIAYTAPDAEVTETENGADPIVKLSPYARLVVQQGEVEVKPGENDLIVELVPGAPPPAASE